MIKEIVVHNDGDTYVEFGQVYFSQASDLHFATRADKRMARRTATEATEADGESSCQMRGFVCSAVLRVVLARRSRAGRETFVTDSRYLRVGTCHYSLSTLLTARSMRSTSHSILDTVKKSRAITRAGRQGNRPRGIG